MPTRYNTEEKGNETRRTGYANPDIPDDFDLPACGIEDVDRAVFNLFNKELPLVYESEGEAKRIPVIFATGERAFILRRKEPLRDRQGGLILPLISILRSGIDQDSGKGVGIGPGTGEIIIKKKISSENDAYKRLMNHEGLDNQDGVATIDKHKGPSTRGFSDAGNTASLLPSNSNVYEILAIPSPRFFEAKYQITFWAQYLQQMNNMQEALMISYNLNPAKSFKIESDKGYWFVAHVDSPLSSDNNFDGFNDEERLVKCTFDISVNGYIINPDFPGSQKSVRRYFSAPRVSFETPFAEIENPITSPIPSGDPQDYVLDDLSTVDDPYPGSAIGHVNNDDIKSSSIIGGKTTSRNEFIIKTIFDPFTGETSKVKVAVKTKNSRKGETVFRRLWTLG
jgi:hypothetical protein